MIDTSDPTAPDPGEAPALLIGVEPLPDEGPSQGSAGDVAGGPARRRLEIEYTSRGDRVPARVLRPAPGHAAPRLVVRLDSDAAAVEAGNEELAGDEALVFAPDLPLCGRRATPKLSDQLGSPPPGDLEPGEHARLLEAAERQAVADVRRGLTLLCDLCPGLPVDAPGDVIASGGFATRVAHALCRAEPRLTLRGRG